MMTLKEEQVIITNSLVSHFNGTLMIISQLWEQNLILFGTWMIGRVQ